jgi:RNA polymerase sigma factor (sigma-70 family)
MNTATLGAVLRHVGALAAPPAGHERTDQQLLHDFCAAGDQAAFTALVRRHGPMVLGVCRHVLRQEQDAEDAFQATFWALARNAGSVRNREALAGWLHGVAYRTAVFARRSADRRRMHEGKVKAMPQRDPSWESTWREVQALLDEEIGRLPDKCRAAFVLCHLEGHSRAEAARQLGLKEGTISSRLDQARKRLQQRLSQRGVVLTVVLGAAALGDRAATAVPARLARATVQTALGHTAGSAAVAGLVRGVAPTLLGTKLKIMTAVLTVAGILAAGAGALAHRGASAQAAPAAGPETPTPRKQATGGDGPGRGKPAAPTTPADGAVVVKGRVLGPDGKPVAGAKLSVWTDATKKTKGAPVGATTGEDGRFRLAVARADLERNAQVVATAKGQGPDWVKLESSGAGGDIILRLARDDVPVDGRILDLEGRPVAGATVRVRRVEQRADPGDLGPWVEAKRKWARGEYDAAGVPMKSLAPEALGVPAAVTTGKDGRFRLTGVGRERVVHLLIQGKDLADAYLEAITRAGPLTGLQTGDGGSYPAAFDYLAVPGKVITGIVQDKRTGKPLAGIRVVCPMRMVWAQATTDQEGRYRLTGLAKRQSYWVAAGGVPYFNSTRLDVRDTPGLEPVTVDFDLERGIAVRGRLLDKATGNPVRGRVSYVPLADNPHLKDFTEFGKPQVLATDPGRVGPDGSFTVVAIPGRGLLCAQADDAGRFAAAEPDGVKTATGLILECFHQLVPVDVSEKEPKSLKQDIALEPARTIAGSVVGPDGGPLAGAHAAGLAAIAEPGFGRAPRKLPGADFTAGGLVAGRPRPLFFFHPEKRWSKVYELRGDEDKPLTVRLEAPGGFTGRVVDAGGRPLAGVKVSVALSTQAISQDPPRWRKVVPRDLVFDYPAWGKLLNRELTTDAGGKFRAEGLAPGLPYEVVVTEEGRKPGAVILSHRLGLSAEPGKSRDLGDLKCKPVPGEGGEEP